ncbi:hypothetical protein B0H14DRAFT_3786485 [Mycena olivaceomarginata]|nr:hypothetical protein B0H14DRAFT_3786485 [Mycena olivaceomarginata]
MAVILQVAVLSPFIFNTVRRPGRLRHINSLRVRIQCPPSTQRLQNGPEILPDFSPYLLEAGARQWTASAVNAADHNLSFLWRQVHIVTDAILKSWQFGKQLNGKEVELQRAVGRQSRLKVTETVLRSRGTVIGATQRIRWREESMHKLRKKQKEAASERGGGCEPPCEPIFKMGIWLIVVAVATSLEIYEAISEGSAHQFGALWPFQLHTVTIFFLCGLRGRPASLSAIFGHL